MVKSNCKNCGAPLTKGNTKVVRPRGKKRPYRIHRRCPEVVEVTALGDRRQSFVPVGNTAADVVQRPQVSTGDPLVVEGVLEYSEPPRYRYFVLPASVEKLKKAIEKGDAWFWGFASNWSAGITIEIIPVLEEVAEMNPEAVEHYVEVEFKWKGE